MDVKGGRLFLCKRAQPFPRATSSLELGIGRDYVDQVDLVLEGLDGALFNAWQLWAESCFLRASVFVVSEFAENLKLVNEVARLLFELQEREDDRVRYR